MLKKDKLRYNEYFDMQSIFDELYQQSRNNNNFYKLMEVIGSKQNIRLAYRNLKGNTGSKTKGTDGKTIEDISKLNDEMLIKEVRARLEDYNPLPVRRVYIPKPGSDKKRPLGIPTIWDRLIQQCILQVLEPICEPKFHNHSYGFRPNRSTHHAVSRMVSLINLGKHYYCVDIDIKGFFDNVNHGKLMKQIWNLGIRDKRLLCIISKLLKCEIEGEGIPTKGTPQGGILSPLLSNIVLNELDWWISDQWETYMPRKGNSKGFAQYARQYTNLKDGYIVRYADDFKIMCRTYPEAQRYYHAVVDFLNNRLGLEISPEKSKVTNLKKNSSDFLGFKIKAVPQGKSKYGYVAKTDMCEKALKKSKANLRQKILEIQNHTNAEEVKKYNSAVTGIQNYYRIATNVYNNLTEVDYALLRTRIMSDFYDLLLAQPEEEAKDIALSLELFVNGSLNIFNHQTNVDVDNRFTVYGIRDLGTELSPITMLVMMESIQQRIVENGKKGKATWLYIDEFHVLLNSEYSAKYLQQLWKKVRKQGGLCTGITQNVVDLLQNYTATTMLANSEFVALLKQANTDSSKMAEVIGVSEAQLRVLSGSTG